MLGEVVGDLLTIPVQEMHMKSFFESVQAADPNHLQMTGVPEIDPGSETKVGELDDFERRIIVVRNAVTSKMEEAIEVYVRARHAHRQYHDENPDAEHGGPRCEALQSARKVCDAIANESREIASILASAIRLRHPEYADSDLGIRIDGSIVLKQQAEDESVENAFVRMLAGALEDNGIRAEILRG